ncbi:MAG: hypothetical protein ACJ8AK_06505 [Gemmatimonadaceae bacterium]
MALAQHDRMGMALVQLETALRLYFEGQDYYSVISLSGAADEIFGQLLTANGVKNSVETIKKAAVEIHKHLTGESIEGSEIAHRANLAKNALKHWNVKKQPRVVSFDAREEAVDMLNRAIDNYWALEQNLSSAMQRFQQENLFRN